MEDTVERKELRKRAEQNLKVKSAIIEHRFAQRVMQGQIVATPGAIELLHGRDLQYMISWYLNRYTVGDWDVQDPYDADQNIAAIGSGDRILAPFKVDDANTVWIITDAAHDVRAITTVLLPDEY